jgi:hypothetical protein
VPTDLLELSTRFLETRRDHGKADSHLQVDFKQWLVDGSGPRLTTILKGLLCSFLVKEFGQRFCDVE